MTETLEILDRLVGFNTVSHNSNAGLASYVEDYLKVRGFEVHRIPDPSNGKVGLYAQKGPAGEGVLLSAHTDVVPTEGQNWSRDPFRLTREDGRVYGRGTTDMKGFVATMLALADRAKDADLREPLKFVLSYDEEVGCVGLQRMLDRLAPLLGQPRACLVGEPTEMQVAIGHKGKAVFKALCHGQAGHSALAPKFVNALHMATDFVIELRAIQSALETSGYRDADYDIPYSTVHVGMLSGGRALNIVPDKAELTFEFRHLPKDKISDIQTRIEKAAQKVVSFYQENTPTARIEIEKNNSYPGLDVQEIDAVIAYAQGLAKTDSTTKVAFGTEAGFFSELGIPTVVCGPGSMERQGHKPDEYLELSELAACDAMMDRVLADLSK